MLKQGKIEKLENMRDNFDRKDSSIYRECPSDKTCYTKKEAQTTLNELSGSHNIVKAETGYRRRKIKHAPKRMYKCDECDYWHLTSKATHNG